MNQTVYLHSTKSIVVETGDEFWKKLDAEAGRSSYDVKDDPQVFALEAKEDGVSTRFSKKFFFYD